MRAFAAVFARELRERRLVFPVALGAGLLPLFVSLATGWSRPSAADTRILAASILAATLALAFGLLFGGSVIAGETAEKRLSFHFSRPLSAGAIWGGKLAAALVLTAGPALVALLPVLAAGAPRSLASLAPVRAGFGAALAFFLGLGLLLVLGAHAAATLARLRSPWIALDALFAGLSALGVALAARTLLRDGILPRLPLLASAPFWAFLALVTAFALAATYVQVAVGRTDPRRAHGAFSATLWSLVGASVLALGGYAGWVASARATHLASIEGGAMAAPRGSWIAAGGPLRAGRGAGLFLFDTSGERSLRIRSGDAVFSGDGARAAWAEERVGFFEKERKADLFVADLATAKAFETSLATSVWSRTMLSPSGRRLAVFDDGTLSVYEISDPANARQIMALRIEKTSRSFAFVGEDTLRLFPRVFNAANKKSIAPRELEIEEVDLLSKKSVVSGGFDRETLPFLRLSADGRHLVGTRDKRLEVLDGRTGALLATLSSDLESPKMRFLSGDRMVVAGVANGKAVLKIFLEGEKNRSIPSRSVDLGPAANAVLGGEVAPGRVAVALNPFRSNDPRSRAWKLAFVDVGSGAVSPGPDGLVPADLFSWWFSSTLPPAEASSASSRLFLDADSRLVRLDPATGVETVLLGRSK